MFIVSLEMIGRNFFEIFIDDEYNFIDNIFFVAQTDKITFI